MAKGYIGQAKIVRDEDGKPHIELEIGREMTDEEIAEAEKDAAEFADAAAGEDHRKQI